MPPEADEEISERLSAPHTKRAYLPVLVGRVRRGWEPVRDAALARDPADDGYGLDIGRGVGWGFVADVEVLLTALHSTLDARRSSWPREKWLNDGCSSSRLAGGHSTRRTQNFDQGEGYVLLSRIDAVLQTLLQHIDALEASLAKRVSLLGR